MGDSAPRRRAQKASSAKEPSLTTATDVEVDDQQSSIISLLDIVRVLLTLLTLAVFLSYYLTSGQSFTYNQPLPWFFNRAKLIQYFSGPLLLTPAQLELYNGTDPNLPVYLAINGTIFDVTAGSHTYGPGGSYAVFAGRDASRAFVTGCFLEDRTSDLRGAEMVYLPLEDDDEEVITSSEKKMRAEKERREAKKRVVAEVQKWEEFYRNHKKYFEVGKVVGVEEYAAEAPKLCEPAEKGRPKRKNMNKKKKGKVKDQGEEARGKPVQ